MEALTFILSHLVSATEKIKIEERVEGDSSSVYFIEVDPQDMGKIIGKEGKIIRAIRSVSKIWAVKQNKHVGVELVETAPRN